jgi:hypothetical protein
MILILAKLLKRVSEVVSDVLLKKKKKRRELVPGNLFYKWLASNCSGNSSCYLWNTSVNSFTSGKLLSSGNQCNLACNLSSVIRHLLAMPLGVGSAF